jgi:hypothetical protein
MKPTSLIAETGVSAAPARNNTNRNKSCVMPSHCPGTVNYVTVEVRGGITHQVNSINTSGSLFLWEFHFQNAVLKRLERT